MSQQTRLEVVVPRFLEWIARWPTPGALADAPESDVLLAWAGLGYYARARNLHRAAKAVAAAGWPGDAAGLRALPGVGVYTAAAVASLAFGERVAMVDGNVLRVLSRVHALGGDPRTGRGAKALASLADAWIGGSDAGTVNEATMELGALVCAPSSPRCPSCPLVGICRGAASGTPERFPSPRPRSATVEIRARAVVALRDGHVLLRRAAPGELLAGLWTLPEDSMLPAAWLASATTHGVVRHAITRHRIAWEVLRLDAPGSATPAGTEWVPASTLRERLVSSLPAKALARAGLT